MPHFLDSRSPDFDARFAALLAQKRETEAAVDADAAAILADVEARGDAALIALTERWDRLSLTPETLAFSAEEIDAAIAGKIAKDLIVMLARATIFDDPSLPTLIGRKVWCRIFPPPDLSCAAIAAHNNIKVTVTVNIKIGAARLNG